MAIKPAINKTTAPAPAAARASKPVVNRVTTVKHSKTMAEKPANVPTENPPAVIDHDVIAKLAYGYWEARGYQGGSPAEDWFRAEAEYRR